MTEAALGKREQKFLDNLRHLGGRSGNMRLSEKLGWQVDTYWNVQQSLVDRGLIIPGRGKGGSVALAPASEPQPTESAPVAEMNERASAAKELFLGVPEHKLYKPITQEIRDKWVKRRAYDQFVIEETHTQGSRRTGGRYSRPDVSVAAIKAYKHLPGKHFEVSTFEVKRNDETNVIGVMEALAHREASHRAYVLYHISSDDFDATGESNRIITMAERLGIGVYLVTEPSQFESWDLRIEARRVEPELDSLDQFLGGLSSSTIDTIVKWQK